VAEKIAHARRGAADRGEYREAAEVFAKDFMSARWLFSPSARHVLSQQNHLRPGTKQREFTGRARSREKAAKPPELQTNPIGNSSGA
jgi:hypothetical protein